MAITATIGGYVMVMGVKEIEEAIAPLPANDVMSLLTWLDEYHAQLWDKEIESDLESGRLDAILAEVDDEVEAGLAQPL